MSQEQSPFHTGELAIQERARSRTGRGFGSRAIRTFMPDQHREFFSLLSLLLVGSLDADGYPSASVLWGPPASPVRRNRPACASTTCRKRTIRWRPISRLAPASASSAWNGDPPPQPHEWTGPGAGRKGFHGRRRAILRKLSQVHPGAQPSARLQDRKSRIAGRRTRSTLAVAGLAQRYAVHRQPACRPAQRRVDVSHRGGPPGFLRLGADGRLWLPDYAGNRLFNTLGNLLQDPRCGLLFIDFDNGDLLHLHAEAELFWPGSQPSIPWPAGAERLLALRPAGWRWRRGRLPLAFGEPQPSPFLPAGES